MFEYHWEERGFSPLTDLTEPLVNPSAHDGPQEEARQVAPSAGGIVVQLSSVGRAFAFHQHAAASGTKALGPDFS